jgi:type I restriction enzyme M protein
LKRWGARDGRERKRAKTEQSFCVPKVEIAAQGYDLSINRYREVVREEVVHRAPVEILTELGRIEVEIQQELKALGGLLR